MSRVESPSLQSSLSRVFDCTSNWVFNPAQPQVEEQAAAGEAEVVGAATVEAALEAATMAEAAAVVEVVEMAEAAEMAVVWDTAETAARRPEIVIEEQPEQSEQGAEGAQEVAAETAVEPMDGDGGGASGEERQASSKIFDPGKLRHLPL